MQLMLFPGTSQQAGDVIVTTRGITWQRKAKQTPCNAQCYYGKSKVCDCQCGGHNHGMGLYNQHQALKGTR